MPCASNSKPLHFVTNSKTSDVRDQIARGHIRYGSEADVRARIWDVRLPPKRGHAQRPHQCLQCAIGRSRGLGALFVPSTAASAPLSASAKLLEAAAGHVANEHADGQDHRRSAQRLPLEALWPSGDAPVKDGLGAHVATDASRAAFRPGQLGPVKAKFLADAAYNARIKGLARSAERNFRLPPFVMDYDHDWAFPSLLLLVVEATSAIR